MLRKISLLGGVLGAVLLISSPGFAAKYGMAGCGLGALVFEDQPGMIQIVAGLLNGTGAQTSALTTGSSHCKESGSDTAALFIQINHAALQKDISQGGGESVSTLSHLYQCNEGINLGSQLKESYNSIFPANDTNPDATDQRIQNVIRNDKALAQSCKLFS